MRLVVPPSDQRRCFTPRNHLTSNTKTKSDSLTQIHRKGQRSLQPHIAINSYTNGYNNALSNRHHIPSKPPRAFPRITVASPIKPLSSISDNSSASPPMEEVVEEPFIKKYYYKLGPRDPPLPSARTKYGKDFFLSISTPTYL